MPNIPATRAERRPYDIHITEDRHQGSTRLASTVRALVNILTDHGRTRLLETAERQWLWNSSSRRLIPAV